MHTAWYSKNSMNSFSCNRFNDLLPELAHSNSLKGHLAILHCNRYNISFFYGRICSE